MFLEVAVRVGDEGVGMVSGWEKPFVDNQTVGLVPGLGEQLVGLAMSHDLGPFVDA